MDKDFDHAIVEPPKDPMFIPAPYEGDVEKHLQGQHDQRTHGQRGNGGPGVDITEKLNSVFYRDGEEPSMDKDNVSNFETDRIIKEMKDAETAAGTQYGDNALKIIAERQGFTGKPNVVEKISDLQDIQKTKGGTLVYRGISNYSLGADIDVITDIGKDVTYSADQATKAFREGEYFAGWGMFGNGTYTTTNVETASSYAFMTDTDNGRMGNGKTMAMLIPKNAKMPTKEDISAAYSAMVHDHPSTPTHRNDMGRYLAAKGFQAYDVGLMQADKAGVYVVLDRSMLTVAVQAVEEQ